MNKFSENLSVDIVRLNPKNSENVLSFWEHNILRHTTPSTYVSIFFFLRSVLQARVIPHKDIVTVYSDGRTAQ